MNVQEIIISEICSSPKNPRQHEDPKKLQELAASIAQKGVIEPIIVRPGGKGAGVHFEIVAGERRWKAAAIAKLAKVPCLVRMLTDEEAYDFMLIENLQREDLTDLEEAQSFQAYIKLHGKDGERFLAERTGIRPAYIRSRTRVLTLPAKILKCWTDGKLSFGHMVQLVRVAKDEGTLGKVFGWTTSTGRWGGADVETVETLRRHIDDLAPALSAALFKIEGVCDRCASNSTVQRELFDIATDKVRCHNPSCFKQHQLKAIAEGWKTSPLGKSCGTNRAVIDDEHRIVYSGFYSNKPTDKCRACPDFATRLALNGEVHDAQVCLGKDACHSSLGRQRSTEKRAERDPEAPRASWHGEYFRDIFLSKRIPERLAKLDVDDPKVKALLLACAVHGTPAVGEGEPAKLLSRPPAELKKLYKKVIENIIIEDAHDDRFGYSGFGKKGRRLVAEYLGVDLAKEFAVDKDYLDKKTKAEILAFGKKFKLMKMDNAKKLKKAELVGLILDHGAALVGKVPAEILK